VEILSKAQAPMAVSAADGYIQIDLAGGHRMRSGGSYDPEGLARLIRGLTA
jgi:transposase